jgi:DNA-binding CsgD family transcriptional regulator
MSLAEETSPNPADALSAVLDRARLQVLRATVLIGLLIALGNLVGSIVGFTASGEVTGPATELAAAWCVLWALAAGFPAITARCFTSWRPTMLALAAGNAATVAVSGGIDSPLAAVCMYVGWIASVVVPARTAIVMSLVITGSIVAGYVLAGASVAAILTGQYRYSAVTNTMLPVLTGLVGVLLATVTNGIFSGLGNTIHELRHGATATTPALTALFAGRPVLGLVAAQSGDAPKPTPSARLTSTEREVVALLADGLVPKEIALARAVELSTIRSQIKSAKKKTGARTLPQLVAIVWNESA